MKLIGSFAVCKGFAMCRGHMTSNETYSYTREDTKDSTRFSQIIYLIEGAGTLFNQDNIATQNGVADEVYDLRDHYGKSYKFITDKNIGATWICINPFPANKFFDVKIIKQNTKKTIIGNEKENVIVCVRGHINVNSNLLEQFKYVRISNDKIGEIDVPADSTAIYLTR